MRKHLVGLCLVNGVLGAIFPLPSTSLRACVFVCTSVCARVAFLVPHLPTLERDKHVCVACTGWAWR